MHALLNQEPLSDKQTLPEKTEISPPPLPEQRNIKALKQLPPRAKSEISVVAKPVQAHDLLSDAFAISNTDERIETEEPQMLVSLEFASSEFESSIQYQAKQFTRSPFQRIRDKLIDSYLSLSVKHRQILLFSIYAVTAFTLGFTFYLIGTAPANTDIDMKNTVRLENVVLIPPAETVPPKEEILPNHKTTGSDSKPTEITAKPEEVHTQKQFTNRRTWLRSRTVMKSKKIFRLKKNTPLTVHINFNAPAGWVLAQSASGDIGFIRTRYLSDTVTPRRRR